uniref:Uncharacterized protein n=1 Tax=Haptolina ericina TaxID=156174 RepID=A0A7S3BSD3_9EUKA|mmetsp:Transcript_668/g.1408  ORF Transcript_668/g.1408 Transcript_668/m.1408 type:complete len:195 (+) Transcript_668:35-619(+)
MGVGHAALVLGALGVALSAQAGQPIHVSPKPKLHALYTLRGGVQPAMAERVRPTTPSGSRSASSLQRSIKALPNKVKGKKKKEPTASVTLDVVTTSLCLSAVVAAALGSDTLMAAVDPHMKSLAWMLFGGGLSCSLYALVRLTNGYRGKGINRALCKLIVGGEPSGLVGTMLPPSLLFALGSAASFQTLPSNAG